MTLHFGKRGDGYRWGRGGPWRRAPQVTTGDRVALPSSARTLGYFTFLIGIRVCRTVQEVR